MEKYNFYYDEIYHDSSITIKNNSFNCLNYNNNFKDYIGLYLGYKENDINNIKKELEELEKKWKDKFVDINSEFKSTVFKKFGSDKTCGLVGASQNDLDFYIDLADILLKYNVRLQINSVSKIELFTINSINEKDLVKCKYIDKNRIYIFYFIFSKFLKIYGNEMIFESIKNKNSAQFKSRFKNRLTEIIEKIEKEKDEKDIAEAFKDIKRVISDKNINFNLNDSVEFYYNFIFDGLLGFLNVNNVNCKDANIFIDYQKDTYKALEVYDALFKFNTINKATSSDDILIRATDWMVGLIGRITKRMEMELEGDLLIKEHYLNEKWFDLNCKNGEKILKLYRLLYKLFTINNNHEVIHHIGDSPIFYSSLVYYFNYFKTLDDFNKYNPKEHVQLHNQTLIKMFESGALGFK